MILLAARVIRIPFLDIVSGVNKKNCHDQTATSFDKFSGTFSQHASSRSWSFDYED